MLYLISYFEIFKVEKEVVLCKIKKLYIKDGGCEKLFLILFDFFVI